MESTSPVPEAQGDSNLGAYTCDGEGGASAIPLSEATRPLTAPAWSWVHLDHARPEHRRWLLEQSGLSPLSCGALLEEETRPRVLVEQDSMLLILRGVNLNAGAEPDDMISLRCWIEAERVISLRHRRLLAVQDVMQSMRAGAGPRTPADLLVAIAGHLMDRQAGVVDALEDRVDAVEEQMVGGAGYSLRTQIADFRRQAIGLRRYIAPQRDVLSRLVHETMSWLDDARRARLREIAERQLRLVEEVDAARERAGVAQEELNGRLSEQMNRNMYVLSLVAGVFLPLGLLTGLLGINVGGVPGVENPNAFWVVCGLLVLLSVAMAWLFRRIRLL